MTQVLEGRAPAATASPPRAARRESATTRLTHALLPYVLVLPLVAVLGVFVLYPFGQAIYRSFTEWNGANIDEFVGLANYRTMFTEDPLFWRSIRNGGLLTVAFVAQSVLVPLGTAWLIHHLRSDRVQYWLRILLLVPAVVPTVVSFLVWSQFLQPDGLVNRLVGVVGLDSLGHNWLGDTDFVLFALILVGFPWLNGANTLIYLAGLLTIPHDLYEAARMDGAGRWRTFWSVELPLLRGQTRLLVILSVILGLQNYDNVFLLTQGGPADASVVPGLLLYNNAFRYGQYGYAAAIGVVLFVVIFVLTVLGPARPWRKEH
ncbi:carbohydrate ABC transporter membrane protein 1 (CUT1 family) [Micromonospora kangleipakensis]|uniref:Carbohydrate ABC transporter membrane protein 1 (CUT1 family) n=1 Tax=Micromonospora kangleipakensis TaxID=1077942 RepID=A0A4Q8BGJ2_9ACTN|nr:carbohydrate ABC transporter membrane protein 1 (CUT1 family) [Micromonospora kangleipakensis]